MENLEILKNIKDYMQWCIDRGYHKFTYNDLGWDFKCIDAISLIDDVLNHITKQDKMIQKIHENFCKFDWKNSNGEQVHNQLKELYESIFKNEVSE